MERTTDRFAIIPVRLDDGRWLWLDWYVLTERTDPELATEWGEAWVVAGRHQRPSATRRG